MASIHQDIQLGVTPDEAWAAVRDFGAVHERVASGFVIDARREGNDRVVTFHTGATARERLVTIDDERRRLVYSVVESQLGFAHHQASVEVVDARTRPAAGWCGRPTCCPTRSQRWSTA
jgi:Polyketide cyclase / dehydrase and lipid transport